MAIKFATNSLKAHHGICNELRSAIKYPDDYGWVIAIMEYFPEIELFATEDCGGVNVYFYAMYHEDAKFDSPFYKNNALRATIMLFAAAMIK